MLWGVHTHKAELTGLAQSVFRKNIVCVPFRGKGCQLIFGEGLGGADVALLFFGEGKFHALSQCFKRVTAV